MAWFERSALREGVRRREVLAWAGYDFANSGYTTVVLTAVYNAYFVSVVAARAPWATFAWTLALAVSAAVVMAWAPALGRLADDRGGKKSLLAATTIGCVVATAMLAFVAPGQVALALIGVAVSNVFYSLGEGLIAAFLPELARPESVGRVSGWGWSLGYLGGMATLALCLWLVQRAEASGLGAGDAIPGSLIVTAGIYGFASVPTFVWLRERGGLHPRESTLTQRRSSWAVLRAGLHRTRALVDLRRFLACSLAYQCGIAVVITLAAVYAEQAMHFTQIQTIELVFVVNIAAALGAFAFGYVQDRLGHRRSLAWTLAGWVLMTVIASLGHSVASFWCAALIAGLCMGSSQSCGRALIGVLAPTDRVAECFGLWSMSTRLASMIGPVTYGALTWVSGGNHRLAIAATGVFFLVGLGVLAGIRVERGVAAARDASM